MFYFCLTHEALIREKDRILSEWCFQTQPSGGFRTLRTSRGITCAIDSWIEDEMDRWPTQSGSPLNQAEKYGFGISDRCMTLLQASWRKPIVARQTTQFYPPPRGISMT